MLSLVTEKKRGTVDLCGQTTHSAMTAFIYCVDVKKNSYVLKIFIEKSGIHTFGIPARRFPFLPLSFHFIPWTVGMAFVALRIRFLNN